jgi:hypothetical protein
VDFGGSLPISKRHMVTGTNMEIPKWSKFARKVFYSVVKIMQNKHKKNNRTIIVQCFQATELAMKKSSSYALV